MKLLICLFLVAFANSSPLPQSQESESEEPSLEQPAGHQMVEKDEAQRALHVPKVHVPAHLSGIPILVYPGHHNMIHTGAQVHHQVPQHQKGHVQQPHHQQTTMHHTQQQAHHAQQQMHHAQQQQHHAQQQHHIQQQQMHHTQQHMVHQQHQTQHQMAHAMQSGHHQPQSEHEKMTQMQHQVPLTAYEQYNQYTVPYQYPVLQYYNNPYQHQFHQQYVLVPLALPEQAKSEVHDQMTHHKGKKEGSDEDTVVLRNEELDADSESGGDTMEEEPKETMLDSIEVNADVMDNEDDDAVDIAG